MLLHKGPQQAIATPLTVGLHNTHLLTHLSISAIVRGQCKLRYSQTEKEALALVWACERFHEYLLGVTFKLITDHKPLEVIYGPRIIGFLNSNFGGRVALSPMD